MTLIKAKKQRSKPQAPSNYKLRCTNDFVFKSLMTYDPKIGKRLVKDLTESIRDYVVDKVDLTSTELLTEGFQAKDIRLDICARLTPDRLIDFEMQCGSNKMEIPNRSAYYAATLVNRPDNKGVAYTCLLYTSSGTSLFSIALHPTAAKESEAKKPAWDMPG